ncbi:MAG: holo-ACP synthase [Chloroflexi bacterium]|jgi:holo-[acyl-carrier protein] synthase|nr:holo-ACP synthase [Anaerolineaceae bacterium]NMB87474.1 holo-ACP synthase [Chloroflexota bacterium]
MTELRSGVDLIEIDRLAGIDPAIRQRFLERVFTPGELADAGGSDASLAGRFAAKEAAAKALGCGIGPVSWQEIEVQRGPQRQPLLVLHGAARRLADEQGLTRWSLSISHSRTHAIAMVVALGDE